MGSSLQVQQATNRLTAQLINDKRYTLTSQDIESEMYKQAAIRQSKIVEPVDILFAIARQGHGPAGFILREVIKDIPDSKAEENPVQYLRSRPKPPLNGNLNKAGEKPQLGSEGISVLNLADTVSLKRRHDKVESIDILSALFEDPESLRNISYLNIDPEKVQKRVKSYLSTGKKTNP